MLQCIRQRQYVQKPIFLIFISLFGTRKLIFPFLDVENQKSIIKELRVVLNTAYLKENIDEGFILVVMQSIDKYLSTLNDKELSKEFISWAAAPLSKMLGAENQELVKYGTKYINFSAYDGTYFYIQQYNKP